jgi:hypothetical protein
VFTITPDYYQRIVDKSEDMEVTVVKLQLLISNQLVDHRHAKLKQTYHITSFISFRVDNNLNLPRQLLLESLWFGEMLI